MTFEQFTSAGGKARAKKLTKAQRKAIASQAAKARWANVPDSKRGAAARKAWATKRKAK